MNRKGVVYDMKEIVCEVSFCKQVNVKADHETFFGRSRKMIEKKMMVKAVTVVLGLAVVLFMSPLAAEAGDVAYWSFDEGSGATAADSVGTNDMQASGWTTGGYSDDAIDFSSPSNGYALRSSSVSSALDLTEAVTVDLRMKL